MERETDMGAWAPKTGLARNQTFPGLRGALLSLATVVTQPVVSRQDSREGCRRLSVVPTLWRVTSAHLLHLFLCLFT